MAAGLGGIDWSGMLHDKKFLYPAAAVTAVGVYVLYQKNAGTSTSTAADVAGTGSTTTSTGTGSFDDGGSDIAATLGNFSTELQGILQNYANTTTSTTSVPPKKVPPVVVIGKPAPVKSKPKPRPPTYTKYKIKPGDTLSGLAKKDGTTVSALAKLNGIKDVNLIYAGHELKVPKKTTKKK